MFPQHIITRRLNIVFNYASSTASQNILVLNTRIIFQKRYRFSTVIGPSYKTGHFLDHFVLCDRAFSLSYLKPNFYSVNLLILKLYQFYWKFLFSVCYVNKYTYIPFLNTYEVPQWKNLIFGSRICRVCIS